MNNKPKRRPKWIPLALTAMSSTGADVSKAVAQPTIEPAFRSTLMQVLILNGEENPQVPAGEAAAKGQLQEIYRTDLHPILAHWDQIYDYVNAECDGNINKCADDVGIKQHVLALNMAWERSPGLQKWEEQRLAELKDLVESDPMLAEATENWSSLNRDQKVEALQHYAELHVEAFSDGSFQIPVPDILVGKVNFGAVSMFEWDDTSRSIIFDEVTFDDLSAEEAFEADDHELGHGNHISIKDAIKTNMDYLDAEGILGDAIVLGNAYQLKLDHTTNSHSGQFSREYFDSITEGYAYSSEGIASALLFNKGPG